MVCVLTLVAFTKGAAVFKLDVTGVSRKSCNSSVKANKPVVAAFLRAFATLSTFGFTGSALTGLGSCFGIGFFVAGGDEGLEETCRAIRRLFHDLVYLACWERLCARQHYCSDPV